MGIYRLLLAVAVILSHIGVTPAGHNPGVVAVVSFLLISGYVMTALIQRHYMRVDKVPIFYVDRAMRLFPQFLFYGVLTVGLIFLFHPRSQYLSGITPWSVIVNMAMLPLNFFRYFPDAQLMPQAWSLGLELQFYLVIPIILIFGCRPHVALLSIAFFLLPFFQVIASDTWSYRMLPGTLFIFLLGSFIRTGEHNVLVLFAYVVTIVLFITSFLRPAASPRLFDVTLGVVIGVPAVLYFAKLKFGRLEELAGNVSYGMFLNHFFLIWTFQIAGFTGASNLYIPAILTASFVLAWLSYELVEKRALLLRHRIRNKSDNSSAYGAVGAGNPDSPPPTAM